MTLKIMETQNQTAPLRAIRDCTPAPIFPENAVMLSTSDFAEREDDLREVTLAAIKLNKRVVELTEDKTRLEAWSASCCESRKEADATITALEAKVAELERKLITADDVMGKMDIEIDDLEATLLHLQPRRKKAKKEKTMRAFGGAKK